jgi:hypothetical protein
MVYYDKFNKTSVDYGSTWGFSHYGSMCVRSAAVGFV